MTSLSDDALVLEEGRVLAKKYRLVRPAGFGGMAQLWVAKNESTGADVCVKVLLPDAKDEEAVARFRREAHAAARLSHRAIVAVFDLMELGADGQLAQNAKPKALAIVMELLSGETLSDHLMKKGKLGVDEALDIIVPVAGALAHAHRANIVHRDIKPDNIFLAVDPDGAVIPKVLDFGVSKLTTSDATPLTLDGTMLGTPTFMSPEQAKGARHLDARSDVFSVGIVLYMMLSGQNPFEADSFHEIVEAILRRDPPPIADLPPRIAEVLDRALAKDPARRWRDGTELSVALRKASGRRSLSEPHLLAATPPGVPSDSEITVPPVGTQSIPPDDVTLRALSNQAPFRARALRIVAAVTAGCLVVIVAAAVRGRFKNDTLPPATARTMPHADAVGASVPSAVPTVAPVPTTPAESGEASPLPSSSAIQATPAQRREAAPKKKEPSKEGKPTSIATDPGF